MNRSFRKVLIANRGEIACRIIRTLQKLGIGSVAVYSDADRHSRHVQCADEAVHIGPAPSSASYLNIDAIIAAARQTGADAIHPGYGFLSENPLLAEACAAHGLRFIGPGVQAIRVMGSKSAAKRLMESTGVPLVPGYHGDEQSDARLTQAARDIGFPVLLKAALGGGGKGMRIVHAADELADALASCRREALASFRDDTLLVEKYVAHPRHVEIQVFCDTHGNAVHLFERDCSIQRRHQKIIEECPAPDLPAALRARMAQDAIKAAQAIQYVGAGTVEFLYDGGEHYYFMEMNTRLQVEHPVTECVTGDDLVEWQIRVAEGQALPKTQDQIHARGHAIEVRICAENPAQDFIPSTGPLRLLRQPAESQHVRIDSGIRDEDEVSVYYDPMIAKLIVWDHTRAGAIRRLQQALEQFCVDGIDTNIGYLHAILATDDFQAPRLSTAFLALNQDHLHLATDPAPADLALAALCEYLDASAQPDTDPWACLHGWNLNAAPCVRYAYQAGNDSQIVLLRPEAGTLRVDTGGESFVLRGVREGVGLGVSGSFSGQFTVARTDGGQVLFRNGSRLRIRRADPGRFAAQADTHHKLTSPMPGLISRILVSKGDVIHKGQPLLVLEAMKMEHTIRADKDGQVEDIFCREGETVGANRVLIDIG